MKGALVIVLIAAFFAVCESSCYFPKGDTPYDWDFVEQCFSQWPLTPAKKAEFKVLADKAIASYAFQEWFSSGVADSGIDPIGGGIDTEELNVTEIINAVFARNYTSEWQFHNHLDREIRRFNDYHTRWNRPCWTSMGAAAPFVIASKPVLNPVDNSTTQVIFIKKVESWGVSAYGHFNGTTVVAINGKNPITAIIERGKLSYKGRDPHTHFNNGLWANNRWYSDTESPPRTMQYTLAVNGTNVNVTVPVKYINIDGWSFIINVTNGISNLATACKEPTTQSFQPLPELDRSSFGIRQAVRKSGNQARRSVTSGRICNTTSPGDPLPAAMEPLEFCLSANVSNVAILRIEHFEITGDDVAPVLVRLDEFSAWAKRNNRTKLIIDVTDNGGGYNHFAFAVYDRLVDPLSQGWYWLSAAYLASPYVVAAAKTDVSLWANKFNDLDPNFYPFPFTNESWIDPGRFISNAPYTGTSPVPVSKKYSKRLQPNPEAGGVTIPPQQTARPFTKMRLFGNGLCFSACHAFSWALHQWQLQWSPRSYTITFGGVVSSTRKQTFALGPISEQADSTMDLLQNCETSDCNGLRHLLPNVTQAERNRVAKFQFVIGYTTPTWEHNIFTDFPLELISFHLGNYRINDWTNMHDGSHLYELVATASI